MTKVNSKDWRNLPIEKWNTNTVHAFLIDETKRRFDAEYVPGGKGSRQQRWIAEKGMIKRELQRRGPEVVRKFIEICWREYRTSNPSRFPYPTFGFMIGFMDRHWIDAERAVQEGEGFEGITKTDEVVTDINDDWF